MGENNFNTSKIAKELLQLKSKIVTAQVTIWAKSLNRNFFKQEIQTTGDSKMAARGRKQKASLL
jgi:uncharacterized protein (DUF3084 family)